MYRQGLGDFFLVTLPKKDGTAFRMLIDCGVIVGTQNATQVMRDLVTKMKNDVGNKLDVVVSRTVTPTMSPGSCRRGIFSRMPDDRSAKSGCRGWKIRATSWGSSSSRRMQRPNKHCG